ncbi:hypothetical protein HQ535_01150 [bacterium]|nr:hypothetical protein [bacterium]
MGETDEPSTITSDELCELLPTVEIGVEMDARRDVTTFASPSGASSICTLSIFTGEKTVYMSVELVSNGGDASFEAEAGFVASIYGDAFEIEGVGDRAVGFENSAIQVLVLAGQSVVRIIWPTEEPYSLEQAGEIGRLVAAALR